MPSSRSRSEPLSTLAVEADFPTTEIFVVDSRFRRLASGVGTLEVEVPPGYYKIRLRAGSTQHDQLVEVSPGERRVAVKGEPIAYQTAAPIAATSTTRERHASPAERLSHELHARPGEGSRLFLFVRDLEEMPPTPPWEGVSVHALDGEHIGDLSRGECSEAAAFGALSLAVDPGTYRLRVESGALGTFEMFVITCAGWQTQVFSVAEEFVAGSDHVRRVALRSTSVLMARIGDGFHSHSDEPRLADLARAGLKSGRKVVRAKDLDRLLYGKFDNPMLGIYGGHLLLLAHRPDHGLIDTVADNLQSLVGPHPDVLALRLRRGAPSTGRDLVFPTPPMLESSWDLIVQASRRRVSVVPPGSASDRVADDLLVSRPWLLRRLPEVAFEPEGETAVSFSAGRRLIERLATLQQSKEVSSKAERMAREPGVLSSLERRLLTATQPYVFGESDEEATETVGTRVSASSVLRKLDAPSSSIARSARSLLAKLDLDDAESERSG